MGFNAGEIMNEEKDSPGMSLVKTMANIMVDFLASIVFLAVGALLVPVIYEFVVTAEPLFVLSFVFTLCVALAVFMAYVFD